MFWQGLIFWYDNYGLWPWQAKPRPKIINKVRRTKLMGLKSIRFVDGNGCRTDANMWSKLNHDFWFNYALMRFQAFAYARCPEPHDLKGHWNCIECPRDMNQTDRQTERENQTERERESERESDTERESDRQTEPDRQTENQTDRQTQRISQTDRESVRHRVKTKKCLSDCLY